MASGLWEHEEPLEAESESETAPEAEPLLGIFSAYEKQPQSEPEPPKCDNKKLSLAERRVVRSLQREASRPYHQFVYQVSAERERIHKQSNPEEDPSPPDMGTTAYENVKNIWTRRGIWDKRWGLLPGMTWKHEEDLEEVLMREGVSEDSEEEAELTDGRNEADEAPAVPAVRIFGSPLLYVDAVQSSPATPDSPRRRTGQRVATTGRPSLPSKKNPFQHLLARSVRRC